MPTLTKTPAFLRAPVRKLWDVDGGLTKLLTWTAHKRRTKTLVLFIPGNPGNIDYYEEYLQCMYAMSNASIDIIGVQHAGHMLHAQQNVLSTTHKVDVELYLNTPGINDKKLFERRNNTYTWSLQDQIQHKSLILSYLLNPQDDMDFSEHNIILIGHSVGAYIAGELLKMYEEYDLVKFIGLFPTLEHIEATPRGQQLWPLFHPLGRQAVKLMAFVLRTFLSEERLKQLISMITRMNATEADITCKLVHPEVADNALFMARTEMEEIRDLDVGFFKRNLNRFILYYGEDDGWAPPLHYKNMTERFPGHKGIFMCQRSLPHAFTLGDGAGIMAEQCIEWIRDLTL